MITNIEKIFMFSDSLIEILETRYGNMFVFKNDKVIGRSLRIYGEWAEHEISILSSLVRPNTTILDIGANIGTHTLAFAKIDPTVDLVAIEAQPLVFCVLQMNCLVNGLSNAACHNILLSHCHNFVRISKDNIDWQNLGGTSFTEIINQIDSVLNRNQISNDSWLVPVTTLDSFKIEKPISLIKIDVEGMELDVIRGGLNLINKYRPYLFAEQLNIRNLNKIKIILEKSNYSLYWLETHPFNSNNYREEQNNIWWRTEMGILGVPREVSMSLELPVVTDIETCITHQFNARLGTAVETNKL